jgi:hypothetical protein
MGCRAYQGGDARVLLTDSKADVKGFTKIYAIASIIV